MSFVIIPRAVLSFSKDSRVSKVLRDYSAPKSKHPSAQLEYPFVLIKYGEDKTLPNGNTP